MSIPPYIQGYPQDGSSLGSTKTQIRKNLDGTFLTLGVDHVNNNGQPSSTGSKAGYHTVIHQTTTGAIPPATAGVSQIYSKVPTIPSDGNSQLFYKNSGGGLVQMTGAKLSVPTPSPTVTGYAWANGVLFQWGLVNAAINTTGTVNFTPNFPNNIFNITTTPYWIQTNSPNGVSCIAVKNISKTGFNYFNASTGPGYAGFYWLAVGN